jgi:hypothetical protein
MEQFEILQLIEHIVALMLSTKPEEQDEQV